jgi:hypothetical protein
MNRFASRHVQHRLRSRHRHDDARPDRNDLHLIIDRNQRAAAPSILMSGPLSDRPPRPAKFAISVIAPANAKSP